MTELSAIDAARALAGPVGSAAARWMSAPEVLGPSHQYGYPNPVLYYALGRGGVLGAVDADVVVAAFGFFAPDMVRSVWETGCTVEPPTDAAHRYALDCAAYGRARLGRVVGMDRLVGLASRVVDGVHPAGLPLFAGWRALPRPADIAGAAYHLVNLLRELRGGVHIVAVAASALTPLESILAARDGGPDRARLFGWTEPFPDVSALADDRHAVEDHTDQMMARYLGVLSSTERAEMVGLVDTVLAAVSA